MGYYKAGFFSYPSEYTKVQKKVNLYFFLNSVITYRNMDLFTCCTLVLSLLIQYSNSLEFQIENIETNLHQNSLECLENLISLRKYWIVDDFVIFYNDTNIVDDYGFFQRLPNIFSWQLYSLSKYNLTGFFDVIFFVKNFDNFKTIINSIINIKKMDSRSKFLINIERNFSNLDEIQEASNGIPTVMWKLDKIHVLFLVSCEKDILIMTYFPFVKNCRPGDLEVIDTWMKKNFSKGVELFPNKMLDIHGCTQKHIVAFSPASLLHERQEFTETGKPILGGVGGRMITIATEKMNMKLHAIPHSSDYWGQLADKVAKGEALFSLTGTMPLVGQTDILDLDSVYMEESFGLGYMVGELEVSFMNLILPLSSTVWQCIIYTGLIFSCILWISHRSHRSKMLNEKFRILDGFAIFLGNPRILPQSYFGRYLLGTWIVYSYLINAYYNSGLVSFLTRPNEKNPIDTFEDLVADGIPFGGGDFHREFYYDPSEPVMVKIYDNFNVWTDSVSGALLLKRQCATGVLSSYVYVHNSNLSVDASHKIRPLKDRAMTFQVPIPIRRGSPFRFGIHSYVSRAVQAGLNNYWFDYYTRTSQLEKTVQSTPVVISMQHIGGILYLHITGVILSCLVFLGEIAYRKYLFSKSFSSFITFPTIKVSGS